MLCINCDFARNWKSVTVVCRRPRIVRDVVHIVKHEIGFGKNIVEMAHAIRCMTNVRATRRQRSTSALQNDES